MKAWFAAFCLTGSALAENPLSVELISDANAIAAGKTFTLGIHLRPPPGHHVYWKHPGIVGMPTRIEWSLPDGFVAGEIQWPAPEPVKMARYTAQGYRSETLLMAPITPPSKLSSSTVNLTARMSWMCCGHRCQPANNVPFTITLPVAETTELNPTTKPLFEAYRKELPQPNSAWSPKVTLGKKAIMLTLTPTSPVTVRNASNLGSLRFFTADGQVDSDASQKVEVSPDGIVRIELSRSENTPPSETLSGVVVAQQPWGKEGGTTALEIP